MSGGVDRGRGREEGVAAQQRGEDEDAREREASHCGSLLGFVNECRLPRWRVLKGSCEERWKLVEKNVVENVWCLKMERRRVGEGWEEAKGTRIGET